MKNFRMRETPQLVLNWLALSSILLLLLLSVKCSRNDDNPTNTLAKVDLAEVASGFVSPIGAVASPDNTKRLFVIDQAGRIWIIDSTGNKNPTPFLDISSRIVALNGSYDERGLLGLAFHPQFSTNHRFFVYYQLPPRPGGPQAGANWNNLSRIAEFKTVTGNDNLADIVTERTILEWDDPQSNHNGGTIAFGPDGYLYIAIG